MASALLLGLALGAGASTVPATIALLVLPIVDGLPAGWEIQAFPKIPRRSTYTAVLEEGRVVVKAEADASASGMRLRRAVDLKATPVLRWRWRVDEVPRGEDPRTKKGDDYAARVYVVFQKPWEELSLVDRLKAKVVEALYGEKPPTAAINYIWSASLDRGARLPNAYTDRVRMIAVRGKEDPLGRWFEEERDLAEDFRALFGEAPPPVTGLSLMTDADNTRGRAASSFGGLELAGRP